MSRQLKRPDAVHYSQTRSFNMGVAMEVGIGPALIYDELMFYADKGSRGDGWIYKEYADLLDRFPFMGERTVRRHIRDLEQAKYIKTKIMRRDSKPILHIKVLKLLSPILTDANGQSGRNGTAKVAETIYTSTNTATHIAQVFERLQAIIQPKAQRSKLYEPLLTRALKKINADDLELAAKEFVARFKRDSWRDRKYMTIKQFLTSDKDRVYRYEDCLLAVQERLPLAVSTSDGLLVDASGDAEYASKAFRRQYEEAIKAKETA